MVAVVALVVVDVVFVVVVVGEGALGVAEAGSNLATVPFPESPASSSDGCRNAFGVFSFSETVGGEGDTDDVGLGRVSLSFKGGFLFSTSASSIAAADAPCRPTFTLGTGLCGGKFSTTGKLGLSKASSPSPPSACSFA